MNTTIKKIYLDVQPLWWQTDLAKFGFIVLGLGFLYLLYKLTQKQIHEIESSKAERDKRVAGLELQALRSQMNPHFVHNSLNAIQYFIQRNEVELSEDYLAKFSKLIRLFFEYSRKQHITIEDEVSLLENYLQIEKLRFEDKLAYSIEIDDRIQATEQILPSMILQPIVENAVNHGVFHKKGNGIVKVRFNYIDASTFEIMILDDGIGINKAREIHKRSTKNYQSNSSSVLKERVELLQQSEEWDISYSLEDRSENSDETGTIATLVFKNTNDI